MKPFLLIVVLLASVLVHAGELRIVQPETVGFSTERLNHIKAFTQREVDEGRLAGVVTLVARHGKIVHYEAVGNYGVDNDKPMDKDALFRIYSMTKPITAVAMMMLYEEGKFQLGDTVSKYLPEFAEQKIIRDGELVAARSSMTIEQLMTHTAGLVYYNLPSDHPARPAFDAADPAGSNNLEEFVDRLSTVPLQFEPGTRYYYSYAFDVLGALIEQISGITLDAFFREKIFTPLEMRDTYFNVPDEKLHRLATNHYWDRENKALAVAPEGGMPPPQGATLFSGGGGLISTAMDYMIFCEMLRNGGSYNGVRILGPKTVQYMTIDHLTAKVRNEGASEFPASHLYPGHSFGLGVSVITDPDQAQVISSKGAYSWGGIANTKFWIDPEEDLVAILMTQVLGSPWSDATRFNMKIATYQALIELQAD